MVLNIFDELLEDIDKKEVSVVLTTYNRSPYSNYRKNPLFLSLYSLKKTREY